MTISEVENFHKQDEKKYILSQNKKILNFIQQKKKEGINFRLSIEQMQQIINQIVQFFEFKYPSSFITDLFYKCEDTKKDMKICQSLAKTLDIEQLKYRLGHYYVQFLDCSYGDRFDMYKEKKNLNDIDRISVRMDKNGTIEPYDLESIREYGFLNNIDGIQTISDALGRFIESPVDVDYSGLTKAVITHKAQIQLRNMILELIPLKLIYSNNGDPEYGYIRAKSFVRMFNKEYNLNISMEEIEEIMHRDYSTKEKKYYK